MDKNPSQLIQQAEQLFNEKSYKDIITLLPDNILDLYKNAALYAWRARAHDRLDEIEPAFLYANKAIEIDPSFPRSYLTRGNVWLAKKEYDKAIEDYNKAIALDEKYATAYYNRGIAWSGKNEYEKAIDDYTRAIVLDEKNADAYTGLGTVWINKNEHNKAIDNYTMAIALDEKIPPLTIIVELHGLEKKNLTRLLMILPKPLP